MKKILVTFLCVSLILSTTVVSYGDSNKQREESPKAFESVEKIHNEEMNEEIEILEALGFEEEMIIDTKTDNNDDIIYSLQLTDDIVSEISVSETNDGVSLGITEDNLHDDIFIDDAGDIYVDGNEVIYSEEDNNEDEAVLRTEPYYNYWYNKQPPTGCKTYKTKATKTHNSASVGTGKKIVSMTAGALAILFAKHLWVSIPAGLLSLFASDFKTLANKVNPKSAFYSCKIYQYDATKKDVLSTNYKYTGKFWPQKNYKGTSSSATRYKQRAFS